MGELRRIFLNDIKRKPTAVEAAALDRAVHLTWRAETAATNPDVCLDDVVRVDNAAARARKAWLHLVRARRAREAPPSLSELIANERARP